MAQRDQLAALLRTLNAGDACNREHIAFRNRAVENQLQRRCIHRDGRFSDRAPSRGALLRNIDHTRRAAVVEVCQTSQLHAPRTQPIGLQVNPIP
jgi:hypothetical protein